MLPFQSQLPAGDLPPVQVWSGDEHYRDVIRDWCKPPVHETSCHRAHRSEASELLTLDKGSGAVGVGGGLCERSREESSYQPGGSRKESLGSCVKHPGPWSPPQGCE